MRGRVILIVVGVFVAGVVGVAWYVIGGFPRDHDRYASIPIGASINPEKAKKEAARTIGEQGPTGIPDLAESLDKQARSGRTRVELPEGEIRVNWEGGAQPFGTSRTADEAPEDLKVVVRKIPGGRPLKLEESGGYDSVVGDTGWVSWRKFETPAAGRYEVFTTSPSGEGGRVTIGRAFWNPLDSVVLGALLPALVIGAIALVIGLLAPALRRR